MSDDAQAGLIPVGSVLCDFKKNIWIIKSFIGTAGSTQIYAAAPHNEEAPADPSVSIKIERDQNEPPSADMQFYLKNANPADIENWITRRSLQNYGLGVPRLLGSGTHVHNYEKYHFIVSELYGDDLWKLYLENGREFPAHTVYKIAFQTIRVLQYIHSRGYFHADIKAENLRVDSKTQHRVYLTNYALSHRLTSKSKVDPKTAALHSSIEYMSRDCHVGVPTMRGDIEMVFYNMIRWKSGKLPWDNLNDPSAVHQTKRKSFKDVETFLKKMFDRVPEPFLKFGSLLASMTRYDKPKYGEFRTILSEGLRDLHHAPNGILKFKMDILAREREIEVLVQKKKEFIKGLHISVELLAAIISENCSSLNEVDLYQTEPGSIMDIIHKLTNLIKSDESKIQILRDAWENDVANLKTKVKNLWKRKEIDFESAPVEQEDKNEKKNQYSPAATAATSTPSTSTFQGHLGSKCSDGTLPIKFPNTPTCEVEGTQPKDVSGKPTKRRMESSEEEVPRRRERRTNETSKHLEKSGENSEKLAEERTPSSSRNCVNESPAKLPTLRKCQAVQNSARYLLAPWTQIEKISQSSFGNSGFKSCHSTHSGSNPESLSLGKFKEQPCDTGHRTHEWLDVQMPQEVEKLCSGYSELQLRLNPLVNVLSKLSTDSPDATKLNEVVQDWQNQMMEIEKRAQDLRDASLKQLHDVLQGIEDDLDKLSLDKNTEEQLLRKLDALAGLLDSQGSSLVKVESANEQLSHVFSSDVSAELRHIGTLQQNLQQKFNAKKIEIQTSLKDRYLFNESCTRILVWLVNELDGMSETPLVPTDRLKLQQQRDYRQVICDRVMSRETEVKNLLDKGREIFKRSQNFDDQSEFDKIQSQWNRLKEHSCKIRDKLQNCTEYCDKYQKAQNQFLAWLSEVENKLKNLKSISFRLEADIEKQLEELSFIIIDVLEKSGEFEETSNLGSKFIDCCDIDANGVVKNELVTIKDRWDKLNNDLLERAQSLKYLHEEFINFKKELSYLKDKLKLYEDELASYDALKETVKDPKLHDPIKKLLDKTVSLRVSLTIQHQETITLLLKARKQGINFDHLLDDVNHMTLPIASLEDKLSNYCNEIRRILEEEEARFEKELEEINSGKRDIKSEQKQFETRTSNSSAPSNPTQISVECIVISSDEGEVDPEFAGIAAEVQKHVDLTRQQRKSKSRTHTKENELKKSLRNDEQSSKADGLNKKSRQKSVEKKDDDSDLSPVRHSKKRNESQSDNKRSHSRDSDLRNFEFIKGKDVNYHTSRSDRSKNDTHSRNNHRRSPTTNSKQQNYNTHSYTDYRSETPWPTTYSKSSKNFDWRPQSCGPDDRRWFSQDPSRYSGFDPNYRLKNYYKQRSNYYRDDYGKTPPLDAGKKRDLD